MTYIKGQDNPVRVMDAFIDNLDMEEAHGRVWKEYRVVLSSKQADT